MDSTNFIKLNPFLDTIEQKFELLCEIKQFKNEIELIYKVNGPIQDLVIPLVATKPMRLDALWETTCFEFFIKNKNKSQYLEFNFSPSGDWNCYSFNNYRQGMLEFNNLEKFQTSFSKNNSLAELCAKIKFNNCEFINERSFDQGEMVAGPAVILEEINSQKSYWAIKHPQKNPDFHKPEYIDYIVI